MQCGASKAGGPPSAADDSSGRAPGRKGSSTVGSTSRDPAARVEELRQAIELELGGQYARKFKPSAGLGKTLARYTMDLRERVGQLRDATSSEDAAALVLSTPEVLVRVHPSQVPIRLDDLAEVFGVGRKAAVHLVSKNRSGGRALMAAGGVEVFRQRVKALCHVLQVDRKQLYTICLNYPRVLCVNPEVVPVRAAALGESLGVDAAQVGDVC